MEKPIKISLNSAGKTPICPDLMVSLCIHKNKYNIDWNNLFSMAARKNKKRDFLFVSKVLGKHTPIHPMVLRIIGGILCRLWVEERNGNHDPSIEILISTLGKMQTGDIFQGHGFDLTKVSQEEMEHVNLIINTPVRLMNTTLFIGFAETATGIAQAIFSSSANSYYIHTTREQIASIKQSIFFCEEHSHATDHAIYPMDPNIFNQVEDIVLIDDELTTGKTALNLLKHLPEDKNYGIISILDWRSEEWLKIFEQEKSRNITVCSLLQGTIECEKNGEMDFQDPVEEYSLTSDTMYKDICFNEPNLIEGYLEYTGRFGLSSDRNPYINKEASKFAAELKKERIEGNCLCLGTGEFIYLPCLISAELGERVFFHSTTRSPIYAKNIPGYAIRNKVTFRSVEDKAVYNYLYNIPPNFYEQVFIFSEKTLNNAAKETFKGIFAHFNIKHVVFISWNQVL